MKTQFFIPNEEQMLLFGAKIANTVIPGTVLFFQGELGAGKTTLVRGFLRGLGYEGIVKSPTYTIVESYFLNNIKIFHFDLYRLADPEELEYIGFKDYFTPDAICLVEWPERAAEILFKPTVCCNISVPEQGEGRNIVLVATSNAGNEIVKRIQESETQKNVKNNSE